MGLKQDYAELMQQIEELLAAPNPKKTVQLATLAVLVSIDKRLKAIEEK